ncbi:MAG: RecX family transcriptional regulator [Bacillota bacterium]|jgi:regulatory protein|nr:RecX family transcriptional regulator [Bacillota bacterium]MDY0118576.1 RecX family transcriptional regulator [Bacilli bacterium]HOF65373.1 RecX family transcriptional regulator [Bacilli bacterium]
MIITNIRLVKNKVIISLDNNQTLTLPVETLSYHFLKEGFFISEDLLKEIRKFEKKIEVFNYAITLLKRRDYFKNEVKQKIVKKQYDKEIVFFVIKRLEELHYLDDESLLNRLIEKWNNQNYSNKNIKCRLFKKGLNKEDFKNKLNNDEREIDKAKKVAYNKMKDLSQLGGNPLKIKLVAYLKRKGFDTNIVIRALDELEIPPVKKENLRNEIKNLINIASKNTTNEKSRKLVFKKLMNKGYNYNDIEKEMENIHD